MAEPAATAPTEVVTPINEPPEFQMALAAEVAKQAEAIETRLMAKMAGIMAANPVAASAGGDMQSILSKLAMSIAELNDQGKNKKVVAPEIMEARKRSWAKMEQLLEAAQSLTGDDRPKYRIMATCWFKDRLIHPYRRDPATKQSEPVHIYYRSIPNQAMRPANAAAKAIHRAFMGSMVSNGEAEEVPFRISPVWMTDNGAIIAGNAPITARERGLVRDETVDADLQVAQPNDTYEDDGFTLVGSDPNSETVHVLGTIAAPARKTGITERLV